MQECYKTCQNYANGSKIRIHCANFEHGSKEILKNYEICKILHDA